MGSRSISKSRRARRSCPIPRLSAHVPLRVCSTWKEVFYDCEAHLKVITGLLLGNDDRVVAVLLKTRRSLEASCSVPACPLEAYSLARRRMIHHVLQLLQRERQSRLEKKSSPSLPRRVEDRIGSRLLEPDPAALLASRAVVLLSETGL